MMLFKKNYGFQRIRYGNGCPPGIDDNALSEICSGIGISYDSERDSVSYETNGREEKILINQYRGLKEKESQYAQIVHTADVKGLTALLNKTCEEIEGRYNSVDITNAQKNPTAGYVAIAFKAKGKKC